MSKKLNVSNCYNLSLRLVGGNCISRLRLFLEGIASADRDSFRKGLHQRIETLFGRDCISG